MLFKIAAGESGKQPPLKEHINVQKEGFTRFLQNRDYKDSSLKSYILSNFKGVLVGKYDILIDKYGTPGEIRYGEEGFINVAMMKINVFQSEKHSESIRNFFEKKENIHFFKNASIASTRASLNWNLLKKIKIAIVPAIINCQLFKMLKFEIECKEIDKKLKNIKAKLITLIVK